MDDKTMLNKQLSISFPTLINEALIDHTDEQDTGKNRIKPGDIIKGEYPYTIEEQLTNSSGEADIFRCTTSKGNNVIAKIYKRENPIKPGIIDALKKVSSPYVARIYDVFDWKGRTVVILPYYRNGSIFGKTYTFEELKNHIIPDINNGLKAIHETKMLHKDLKPANIMLCDNNIDVAIIDFGISSLLEDNNTVLMTKTGMTPVYSAPEVFNGLASVESDYYSFGITLYELYCGKTPYEGLSAGEIAKYTSLQRIPLPSEIPDQLKLLISALTYPDLSNRNDKSNPNRRWTYAEVCKWIQGNPFPAPGGITGTLNTRFNGKIYNKVHELIESMGLNWDEGKQALFHGMLSAQLKTNDLKLYELSKIAEKQAVQSDKKDDSIFFEFLYTADPELLAFFWQKRRWETISAFGRDMLNNLWNNNDSQNKLYDSILSEKIISTYVKIRSPGNIDLLTGAQQIENRWNTLNSEKMDTRSAYYLLAYLLSGQRVLKIDNIEIRTLNELEELLNAQLSKGVNKLIEFTHKLIDYNGILDVQLETWLEAIGKQNELDLWKLHLSGGEQE